MTGAEALPRLDQARALGDPTRYEIYRHVASAGRDVDVAELTTHTGLNHNAVRQHLAKLVAAGLVTGDLERRSRPGRPRLVYRPAAAAPVLDSYERLAAWLTEVVSTGDTPVEVGRRVGMATAVAPSPDGASPVEPLRNAMDAHGFAPSVRRRSGSTEIVLGRCPFSTAVLTDPDTICGLHLGIAEGAAARAGGVRVDQLIPHDPRRAGCRLLVSTGSAP